MQGLRVQDLGEQGLLQRLQRFCPPEVVGDDGAIVTLSPGKSLVVTTDALVDGVHFSDRTTSAADAGWRAAAANLSDLAAMGADPLGITVALGLPGGVQVAWVEQLYHSQHYPELLDITAVDILRHAWFQNFYREEEQVHLCEPKNQPLLPNTLPHPTILKPATVANPQ